MSTETQEQIREGMATLIIECAELLYNLIKNIMIDNGININYKLDVKIKKECILYTASYIIMLSIKLNSG